MIVNTINEDSSMETPTETKKIYDFANGVPGFPEFKKFYIKNLKEGFYDPLKLMVSIDNPAISFILYPHKKGSSFFDKNILCEFAKTYDREEHEVEVYSVVTVREPNGHLHLTTNLKAPIILDKSGKQGWQHILLSKDSDFSFPLDELSQSLQKIRAECNTNH